MAESINIGGIYADLDVNSGNLVRGLSDARRALSAVESEIETVRHLFSTNAIGANEYADRITALNQTWADLVARMNQAHAAVQVTNGGLDLLAGNARMATGATNGLARSLMQIGYMADDIQYGFGSIVNNIAPAVQGIAQGMGASASAANGYAAAAQVAAVVTYQLYQHWDEVRAAFGDTAGIEKARESIEGLAKEVKRLKEDAEDTSWWEAFVKALGGNGAPDAGVMQRAIGLDALHKGRKAVDQQVKKMEGQEPDDRKKSRERFEDAVAESGGIHPVANRLAEKRFNERGASGFLDDDKAREYRESALRLHQHEEARQAFNADPTNVEKWQAYNALEMTNYDDKLNFNELKGKAREKAKADAVKEIAEAGVLGDPERQRRIGDEIGGREGDLLAGRKFTKKEQAKAEKAADVAIKGQDAADRKKVVAAEKKKRGDKKAQDDARKSIKDWLGNVVRDARQAKFERFSEFRDAQDKAKEKAPDAASVAEKFLARSIQNGQKSEDAAKALADHLVDKGLDGRDAKLVADKEIKDARERINQGLQGVADQWNEKMMGGERRRIEEAGPSNSEVFAASSLTSRVQSAISDKPTHHETKMETLQGAANRYLATIASKIQGPSIPND